MEYGVLLLVFCIVVVTLIIATGIFFERRQISMEEKIYTLYKSDVDFKEYVDRYCVKHNINMFEAFAHRMIRIVAKEIMDK